MALPFPPSWIILGTTVVRRQINQFSWIHMFDISVCCHCEFAIIRNLHVGIWPWHRFISHATSFTGWLLRQRQRAAAWSTCRLQIGPHRSNRSTMHGAELRNWTWGQPYTSRNPHDAFVHRGVQFYVWTIGILTMRQHGFPILVVLVHNVQTDEAGILCVTMWRIYLQTQDVMQDGDSDWNWEAWEYVSLVSPFGL